MGAWGVAADGDLFRPKPPSPTRLLLQRIQVISGAEALRRCLSSPDVPCCGFTLVVLSSNRDCPVAVCRATLGFDQDLLVLIVLADILELLLVLKGSQNLINVGLTSIITESQHVDGLELILCARESSSSVCI